MPRLTFWFEFASTYSYLAAMRIEEKASGAGVAVKWQPFLLGPIFGAQGWKTSPFNIYPAKGRYMVRDIARVAHARGLAFRMPEPFPANSLKAARMALIGCDEGWVAPFAKAVFAAEFSEGANIAGDEVLASILVRLGLDASTLMQRAGTVEVKERLRAATAEAEHRGIFGAPTFVTVDDELFWGDDRLEAALAHARGT